MLMIKHFQKTQIEGTNDLFQLTLYSPLLKELKVRLKQEIESEITEESCLLVLKASCTARFPDTALDYLSTEWNHLLWTEPHYMD